MASVRSLPAARSPSFAARIAAAPSRTASAAAISAASFCADGAKASSAAAARAARPISPIMSVVPAPSIASSLGS